MNTYTGSLTGLPGAGDVKVSARTKLDTGPIDAAYGLSPEQADFFKRETGIDNDDDLKAHIVDVKERAYKIFPYVCIKFFMFLTPGISTLPEYQSVIKLGRERRDELLLDIGCCFGVDARKAVADGFPLRNVVISDLKKEFFDLGHALFNTTPETYPISFVAGDVFDPQMLEVVPPSNELPSTERPDLTRLVSLNPLTGRCAVIYASNFFHLFSEENQLHLAKALAGLLSAQPGSMICGEHCGASQKGTYDEEYEGRTITMFRHSPESWRAVWDGEVFPKGTVRVNATLQRMVREPAGSLEFGYDRLQWSVVRM